MAYQYLGGPYQLGVHQKVAFTGTAGTSAVISSGVNVVRVCMTSAGYIKFGTAPTATNADIYMPAGVVEYFIVPPGGTTKISAIQDSAGGNVHITELTR